MRLIALVMKVIPLPNHLRQSRGHSLESARFSYLRGNNNDLIEKTTILCFPGDHLVDNRPGFGIRNVGGVATAVSPSGTTSNAADTLTLNLESNFDLNARR